MGCIESCTRLDPAYKHHSLMGHSSTFSDGMLACWEVESARQTSCLFLTVQRPQPPLSYLCLRLRRSHPRFSPSPEPVVHEGHARAAASRARDRGSIVPCTTSFVYFSVYCSGGTVSGTVNVWKGNRITPSMTNEEAQEVNQRRLYTCSSESFPTGRERSPGIHL